MRGRLDGLDALRGMAALMVVVGHAHLFAEEFSLITRSYYLAVDLFFMLSGYVMARTYEGRLATDLTPAGFLLIRLKRLWPTMVTGAILGFFSGLLFFDIWISAAFTLMAVLLIPYFGTQSIYPTNTPQWSLLFEIIANICHSFVPKLATWWYVAFALVGAAPTRPTASM